MVRVKDTIENLEDINGQSETVVCRMYIAKESQPSDEQKKVTKKRGMDQLENSKKKVIPRKGITPKRKPKVKRQKLDEKEKRETILIEIPVSSDLPTAATLETGNPLAKTIEIVNDQRLEDGELEEKIVVKKSYPKRSNWNSFILWSKALYEVNKEQQSTRSGDGRDQYKDTWKNLKVTRPDEVKQITAFVKQINMTTKEEKRALLKERFVAATKTIVERNFVDMTAKTLSTLVEIPYIAE